MQNQLNINNSEDVLNKDSRKKIVDLVQKFMKLSEQQPEVVNDDEEYYEQLTLNFDEV